MLDPDSHSGGRCMRLLIIFQLHGSPAGGGSSHGAHSARGSRSSDVAHAQVARISGRQVQPTLECWTTSYHMMANPKSRHTSHARQVVCPTATLSQPVDVGMRIFK